MAKRKRDDVQAKATTKSNQDSETSTSNNSVGSSDASKDIIRLEIPFQGKEIVCARKGPPEKPQLICTHGAGGTIDSPGMTEFLKAFQTYACFQGSMNMKSRVKFFHAVMEHFDSREVLGGRSMGARAAVVAALELKAKPEALILVSYPLTGGKEGNERQPAQRERILLDLPEDIDVLFAIGSEDNQCDLDLLQDIIQGMKARTWLLELKGADHGTSVKQKAGVQPMRAEIGNVAASWLRQRDEKKRYCAVSWDQTERCITSQGWQSSEKLEPKSSSKRKKN